MRIVAEVAAILIAFFCGFQVGVYGLIRMAQEQKRNNNK